MRRLMRCRSLNLTVPLNKTHIQRNENYCDSQWSEWESAPLSPSLSLQCTHRRFDWCTCSLLSHFACAALYSSHGYPTIMNNGIVFHSFFSFSRNEPAQAVSTHSLTLSVSRYQLCLCLSRTAILNLQFFLWFSRSHAAARSGKKRQELKER